MTEVVKREKGGIELLGELERQGVVTERGLHLKEPIPFGQFVALCALLGKYHTALRFAIGDAIVLGVEMYGDEAYQAFEKLGMSEDGLLEHGRVSRQVPRSIRTFDLYWSHYRAVAALPLPEQKKWLKRASDQQMSHKALRTALRQSNGEVATREVCTCCGRPIYGSVKEPPQ